MEVVAFDDVLKYKNWLEGTNFPLEIINITVFNSQLVVTYREKERY